MSRGSVGTSRDEVEALAGELLGASIRIDRHPGLAGLPFSGTIVDESLSTFLIRGTGHRRARRVPKSGLVGEILLGERQLPLNGDTLRVRPEDRTKRLLGRGRWSSS